MASRRWRSRSRISTTSGVVLRRGLLGENDRLCVLYTAEHGKLPVRFIGVNRPAGKLKALSEPMTSAEFRLHLREPRGGEAAALCVGGALLSSFPLLRADLARLLRGLQLCELLDRLTPVGQPNPEKHALIEEALHELERAPGEAAAGWLCAAFTLRLLESAGFGVGGLRVSPEHQDLWRRLHSGPLAETAALPDDARLARLEAYLQRSVERLTERPLKTPRVRAEIAASARTA